MRQRIFIPVILLFMAVIGTSCVSQKKVDTNYSDFRPRVTRLELTMDDYQYLGDVTVEVEYKTYFGIPKIYTVNGEKYDPRFRRQTNIAFGRPVKLGPLSKALYKITDTYPDADYILPCSYADNIEYMNAGRIHHRSLKVKVFAINKVSSTAAAAQQQAQVEELSGKNAELQQQVNALQQELNSTKEALEKAELEARINAQKNNNRRR